MTDTTNRDALERVARVARRRLLIRRALVELDRRLAPLFPLLAVAGGVLILAGRALPGRLLIAFGLMFAIGFSVRELVRARLTEALSAALDESFRGRGVLGSAVEYLDREPGSLDPFERLVLRDAAQALAGFRVRLAVPIGFGFRHGSALLSLFLLGVLALFGGAPAEAASPPKVPVADGREGHERASAEELGAPSPLDLEQLLRGAKSLERQLQDGTLSPEDGFQRLASLERSALEAESDEAHGRAALAARGAALEASRPLERLASALKQGNIEDAREALEALGERLRDPKRPLSPEELSALRAGIERAQAEVREAEEGGRSSDGVSAGAPPQRDEAGGATPSAAPDPRTRADESRRKLEKLGPRGQGQRRGAEALSELDRQLAEAAKALEQDRRKAGEHFARAAEAMEAIAQSALTDDQKKELLEALRRMKERLREQGQSKAEQDALEEFRKKARGEGTEPKGQAGEKDQPGQSPSAGQQSIRIAVEVPEPGQGSSGREGDDQGSASLEAAAPGVAPGEGHKPDPGAAHARSLPTQAGDRLSVARDQAEGEDEAQVVAAAARKGFADPRYQKLYQEYESVREENLRRDHVPSGYRARVLRYFELIRPQGRGGSPEAERRP